MYWFKTKAISLESGGGMVVYIACDHQYWESDTTEAGAQSKLASHYLPKGFVGRYSVGGIDADDCWVVTSRDDKHEGLIGMGGSPAEALADFEQSKTVRWYRGRFAEMEKMVRNGLQRACMPGVEKEFDNLISDIRTGRFKYEG